MTYRDTQPELEPEYDTDRYDRYADWERQKGRTPKPYMEWFQAGQPLPEGA